MQASTMQERKLKMQLTDSSREARAFFLGRAAYIAEFWLAFPESLLKMYIKTC